MVGCRTVGFVTVTAHTRLHTVTGYRLHHTFYWLPVRGCVARTVYLAHTRSCYHMRSAVPLPILRLYRLRLGWLRCGCVLRTPRFTVTRVTGYTFALHLGSAFTATFTLPLVTDLICYVAVVPVLPHTGYGCGCVYRLPGCYLRTLPRSDAVTHHTVWIWFTGSGSVSSPPHTRSRVRYRTYSSHRTWLPCRFYVGLRLPLVTARTFVPRSYGWVLPARFIPLHVTTVVPVAHTAVTGCYVPLTGWLHIRVYRLYRLRLDFGFTRFRLRILRCGWFAGLPVPGCTPVLPSHRSVRLPLPRIGFVYGYAFGYTRLHVTFTLRYAHTRCPFWCVCPHTAVAV